MISRELYDKLLDRVDEIFGHNVYQSYTKLAEYLIKHMESEFDKVLAEAIVEFLSEREGFLIDELTLH